MSCKMSCQMLYQISCHMFKNDKDTIAILEFKVQKSESELFDYMTKTKTSLTNRIEEINVLNMHLRIKVTLAN
jgi:hypothetical protein